MREKLKYLLSQEYLTEKQFNELQENELVIECEKVGYSGIKLSKNCYKNVYWYDIRICQDGYLSTDDDCKTERHDIYVEFSNSNF
jgi:hypothetical protein